MLGRVSKRSKKVKRDVVLQCRAPLAALHSIHHVDYFMFGNFVLRMKQFLSEGVAGSKVHWDVVFGEDFPEFH